MRLLAILMLLISTTIAYGASKPMPPVVVLIVCKVEAAGPVDQNYEFTRADNLQWATKDSMMLCRRQQVPMTDPAEDQGADSQGFNLQRCQRSAMMLGPTWDEQHKNTNYRFWRVACPTPMFKANGEIADWVLPDCGHRDTVICESDTAI